MPCPFLTFQGIESAQFWEVFGVVTLVFAGLVLNLLDILVEEDDYFEDGAHDDGDADDEHVADDVNDEEQEHDYEIVDGQVE
jgi:hypothetical protein